MRIVFAGATGLVGRLLLDALCDAPKITEIFVVGRRATGKVHPKLTEVVGAPDTWPALLDGGNFDAALSTLGTTLSDAGSQEAFFAVDHDLVVSFARAACGAGTRQFLMVSSIGAHAASRNFYLATKGKAEASVAQIGFTRLDIIRPGLLRGRRGGRVRFGERIALLLSPVIDFLTPAVLSRYRSTPASRVAAALTALVGATEPGQFVYHNDELAAYGR